MFYRCVADPAWRLNEFGEKEGDIDNAYMDDDATAVRSEEGAVAVLETSGDFFELMNGKFNMSKTVVAILLYNAKGELKRKQKEGEQWLDDYHIPSKVRVINKVTQQHMPVLREELEAANAELKVEIRRELIRLGVVLYFDVEALDPYGEVEYLGVWVQPAMFTARAVAEATQ